ncbi:hypothetical protein VNI00_013959 [Paramarasmius palmivorus]|uniref:Uncharacterized protein n=1 Tax=Paramarasmius palmivorus TaxID=297713 RepID=A0AAW0BXR0_9AGAR
MPVAVETRTVWPPPQKFLHPGPPPYYDVIPPQNQTELSRDMLITVLEHLSTLIATEFGGIPVRIVAHGGACMLLHPGLYNLAQRKALYHQHKGEHYNMRLRTRDVDYIRRSFIHEYSTRYGIADAGQRLQKCIRETAIKFGLGADWMNADADVALPMASDPITRTQYDPVYQASLKPNNIELYTVFVSKNQKLTLINVPPSWSVALKLVRYSKWDPTDISLLLMNGTDLSNTPWSVEIIKKWLFSDCASMGYRYYNLARTNQMLGRIEHAVQLVAAIGKHLPALPNSTLSPPSYSPVTRITSPGLANKQPLSQPLVLPRPVDPSSSALGPVTKPLTPNGSLDSASWSSDVSATSSARMYTAAVIADPDAVAVPRRKKPRKHGKKSSGLVPALTGEWHLRALRAALPTEGASTRVENLPPSLVYHQRDDRDRIRAEKYASRRREKQHRDVTRERERKSKWEARDESSYSLDFDDSDSDSDLSDTDACSLSDSDTESDDTDRVPVMPQVGTPLEYTPMPEPPPEVWKEPQNQSIPNELSGSLPHPRRIPHHTQPSHSLTWPLLSSPPSSLSQIYSQSHNSTPQLPSHPQQHMSYPGHLQPPTHTSHPYSAQTHADALRHRTSVNSLGLTV